MNKKMIVEKDMSGLVMAIIFRLFLLSSHKVRYELRVRDEIECGIQCTYHDWR